MKSAWQLLWERWGDPAHPAEWDGREGGGRGSQRFWEYLWALNEVWLCPDVRRVLDVGCGKEQFFCTLLSDSGISKVVGIDPECGTPTLEEWRWKTQEEFDVVVCISVLEHIARPEEFCLVLDSIAAPIVLTCELGEGCITMPVLYKCLNQFTRHHMAKMELCPVVADGSNGKWRPFGIVLDCNE